MKNRKGFTLIELLAVIVIMGVLLLVGIPAISRTIENSRRDTFADNVKGYIEAVRNAVNADELKCGEIRVSATEDSDYCFKIATNEDQTKDLMEKKSVSPWGSSDIGGYVYWTKDSGKFTWSAHISDTKGHGMTEAKDETDIGRDAIVTKGATAIGSIGTNSHTVCTLSQG